MNICSVCGIEYLPNSRNQKCCSTKCSHERHLLLKRNVYEEKRRKKTELTNADKIAIMNNEALANGMSYGKWVAKKEYPIKITRKKVIV